MMVVDDVIIFPRSKTQRDRMPLKELAQLAGTLNVALDLAALNFYRSHAYGHLRRADLGERHGLSPLRFLIPSEEEARASPDIPGNRRWSAVPSTHFRQR